MSIFPRLIVYVACMLSCGGDASGSRPDLPLGARAEHHFLVTHPIVAMIKAPLDVPPSQDLVFVTLDEAEFDEQENDEVSKPIPDPLTPFNFHAALANLPNLSFRPARMTLLPLATVSVLRC